MIQFSYYTLVYEDPTKDLQADIYMKVQLLYTYFHLLLQPCKTTMKYLTKHYEILSKHRSLLRKNVYKA